MRSTTVLFCCDLILLISEFDLLGMAGNDQFLTNDFTFIPCEAQEKVMALHTSQHMPLDAVQQLSFWMIFWNRNELAPYHLLDAICCSHHKYQLLRSKIHGFSYCCIWNCHYHLKSSVSGHLNWQKDKPHGRRDNERLKLLTLIIIPYISDFCRESQ